MRNTILYNTIITDSQELLVMFRSAIYGIPYTGHPKCTTTLDSLLYMIHKHIRKHAHKHDAEATNSLSIFH